MSRKLVQVLSLFILSGVILRADYTSAPLNQAVTQRAPYQYAGIVLNARDGYRGSGTVVANPRLVVSCAHLPFNGSTMGWSTDNLWFRAYESSDTLTGSAGQPLPGLLHFANYADLVTVGNDDGLDALAVDFVVYYAYEDLAPGSAGFWYDGQAALVSPAIKCIVGYPSGLYPFGDSRQNMMHQAGPFAQAFTQIWGSYNEIEGVSTGPGNSGGPVFVANESALGDSDQGWRFAAVLVTGSEVALGDANNGAGVVAATPSKWDLVNDALFAIGSAPINDSWAAALTLFGSALTEASNNQWATKEPGEPNHGGSGGGHSLWWRWVAPGDGPVTVNTALSNFNTLLGVYTGGSVNALTAVAANQDISGSVITLTFPAAAGKEYWIAVDGKDGATGSCTMNLSFSPSAPVNDALANATMISGISVQAIGHNFNATKEPGEPNHAGNAGGKSVWWKWTAPAAGQVFLTTAGSEFDTLLGVYTGTDMNALTVVASNDDPPDTFRDTSTLTFTATSGITYWIAVDGFARAGEAAGCGAISLNLGLTPWTPVIVMQPSSQGVDLGNPVALWVVARGAPPLTYQWQRNGTDISGATSSILSIGSLQASDLGDYTVVVNGGGANVTSIAATVSLGGAPVITTQPATQTACAGADITLTMAASSTTPLRYQWQKDGVALTNGGRISGATSATLMISSARGSDAGIYTVVVTNSAYSVTSRAAVLTISLSEVVSMGAGGNHSLFVTGDGGLWSVGCNQDGELGRVSVAPYYNAVQVVGGVVAGAAGNKHSLFLKSDGTLWAMGDNSYGQLGDGTTSSQSGSSF